MVGFWNIKCIRDGDALTTSCYITVCQCGCHLVVLCVFMTTKHAASFAIRPRKQQNYIPALETTKLACPFRLAWRVIYKLKKKNLSEAMLPPPIALQAEVEPWPLLPSTSPYQWQRTPHVSLASTAEASFQLFRVRPFGLLPSILPIRTLLGLSLIHI